MALLSAGAGFSIWLLRVSQAYTRPMVVPHLGVKRIDIVGEVFKINGRNVKFRGVNRHDHHPRMGRYVDDATCELDIRLMKQANINFLRTTVYPHTALIYELCDRYGLYVMDEACNESHGYGIGDKPNDGFIPTKCREAVSSTSTSTSTSTA